MKTLLINIFLLWSSFSLFSQIIVDRQLLSFYGTSSNIHSASLGEIIIGEASTQNLILTNGFNQQSNQQSVSILEIYENDITVKAFPNPCVDHFIASFSAPEFIKQFSLIDPQGKLLRQLPVSKYEAAIRIENVNQWRIPMIGLVITTKAGSNYLAGWVITTSN